MDRLVIVFSLLYSSFSWLRDMNIKGAAVNWAIIPTKRVCTWAYCFVTCVNCQLPPAASFKLTTSLLVYKITKYNLAGSVSAT